MGGDDKAGCFNEYYDVHLTPETYSEFLNENILFSPILLINKEGEKVVVNRQQALKQAKEAGLDLLCVAPLATPPVCKLVNYYQISKQQKRKKKDQKEKAINISFNIEKNDLEVKLNKVHG
ncbi:1319_t:CDS:2 [Funneliformis geosporum]|uniref:1319_t:CDS:1 n=1 Tax=Funneliformis geosporum TaxID=1117311 RepID=A0A9W4WL05_9GLOM|nr:1319_t:CDS:2 [Funneliformis geosporum]